MAKGKPKGSPKTGGRKAGSPNKTTAEIRDAVMWAFRKRGGAEGVYEWSKDNPTEFYRMVARLIPRDIHADVTVSVGLADAIAEARQRLASATPPALPVTDDNHESAGDG